MTQAPLSIRCSWSKIWYSPYLRGEITYAPKQHGVERIYRHSRTGQIRIYSSSDWDGVGLSVNGAAAVIMRKRGRFGRLYIGG